MSKATVKHQFRACLFRVACVDWQSTSASRWMSRRYRLTLQWEMADRTGRFSGMLDSPVDFGLPSMRWSEVVVAVRQHLRLSCAWEANNLRDWTPFYYAAGDFGSSRLVKELSSMIKDEFAFYGDEEQPKRLPMILNLNDVV